MSGVVYLNFKFYKSSFCVGISVLSCFLGLAGFFHLAWDK